MNKKIITSLVAGLIIAGTTFCTTFAAMSNGTVVIGNKAFDLAFANNMANAAEINNAIVTSGGAVYIKDFQGNWINNVTNEPMLTSSIPAVTYKNAIGVVTNYNAMDKDAIVSPTELKVSSVSTITETKKIGDTYTLPGSVIVTLNDKSTKNLSVTWDKVVDTRVAGNFTFTGTLVMTDGILNSNNITLLANLIVIDNVINVNTVTLNKTTDLITVGNTDPLIIEVSPINATNKNVTWTSSNSSIATVNNGVITAVSSGTTIITATTVDGSKTANCTVTVSNNNKGYVNIALSDDNLKVRSDPSLNVINIQGYLYKYDKIEILDTVSNSNGLWDKILYNNKTAYVFDPYIKHYNSPPENVVSTAVNITKQFEVGVSSQIAGDFDGQGLSLGYLQWNIGAGTLQPLLNRMDKEYNTEMQSIFGINYDSILNMIQGTKENQIIWTESINNSTNNIKEPWLSQFVSLCNNQHFKNIEAAAEVYSVNQAMLICDNYKLKTIRGFALAFDIVVQNGSISVGATNNIATSIEKNPGMSEKDLLGIIAKAVADSSGNNSVDVLSRKMAIVNGQGKVHNSMLYLDTNYQLSDNNWR